MPATYEAIGTNANAPFTLKVHRGDGMALLAMNWRTGRPPADFVGFAIEYREPDGDRFYQLKNRIAFPLTSGKPDPVTLGSLRSPFQKFRWVHFPRHAEKPGKFTYRVTPVFMNAQRELSYGEPQTCAIALQRETYAGKLNVTYTRGFVSSQAFVDNFGGAAGVKQLLPTKASLGPTFVPTHKNADEALAWMGFEARSAILEVLDAAIADKKAIVRVVAYDLSERTIIERLKKLGARLKIIIDDAGEHAHDTSGEAKAARALRKTAGKDHVKRQHLGKLQHNKTIVVDGPKGRWAVAGSTNFSWRGLYVQSNNAVIVRGKQAIAPFMDAFEAYWTNDTPATFAKAGSGPWQDLGLASIDAKICFAPLSKADSKIAEIADDIATGTSSSLLYSLAFLNQTPGAIRSAIKAVVQKKSRFVFGIADKKVSELSLQLPDGQVAPVYPKHLASPSLPEPFKSEPTGGSGNRMHHKFIVIDFDKPTARVYLGSYNFSKSADAANGENLLLIKDRKVAVSYMIEALRIFDHYQFRVVQATSRKARTQITLTLPPSITGKAAWWEKYWTNALRKRDRETFA